MSESKAALHKVAANMECLLLLSSKTKEQPGQVTADAAKKLEW
jgi:hypothetical protein